MSRGALTNDDQPCRALELGNKLILQELDRLAIMRGRAPDEQDGELVRPETKCSPDLLTIGCGHALDLASVEPIRHQRQSFQISAQVSQSFAVTLGAGDYKIARLHGPALELSNSPSEHLAKPERRVRESVIQLHIVGRIHYACFPGEAPHPGTVSAEVKFDDVKGARAAKQACRPSGEWLQ
jgi:hypothetical protein